MKTNRCNVFILLFFILVITSSCMPGSGFSTEHSPAGFFMGIWHGWIAPVSLIWSLFDSSVQIYEPVNTGWWYDFGYYISVIAGFGSLSLIRRKRKKNE